MQYSPPWRLLACASALALAIGVPAQAGLSIINDDPDPVGNVVPVGVANDSGQAQKARIEVRVTLEGGLEATAVVSVTVPAQGSGSVAATFKANVLAVIDVGITEGPDPIPQ